MPPAELFETILAESAYAYELRGPRRRQAWENVKKMRSLVRRLQNRGYATMARIANHLDSLTAGDESNAVLEALDAVNLMTVHASKGLEFPIVFVVNMSKGASGPPRPVRLTVDADGEGNPQAPPASMARTSGHWRHRLERAVGRAVVDDHDRRGVAARCAPTTLRRHRSRSARTL